MLDYLFVLGRLTEILDRLKIEYAVGGSVASSVHGVHRSTNDIDFVITMSVDQYLPLAAALNPEFYVDDSEIEQAIETTSTFSIVHLDTMIKADFFISPIGTWETERWRRVVQKNLGTDDEPLIVRVSGAEDMILQKLVWYRLGNEVSDRQWGDILGMVKVQAHRLDLSYLRQWAEHLDLTGLLQRALDAASVTSI
jgi:hypothetical protein